MKRTTLLLVAVVALAGVVAFTAASLHADDSAAPIYVTKIPPDTETGG